jgi:hypothetical protein
MGNVEKWAVDFGGLTFSEKQVSIRSEYPANGLNYTAVTRTVDVFELK